MKGSFYTETTSKGDTPFLIVSTKIIFNKPPVDGMIAQSFVQFKDMDMQTNSSNMNIVCNLTYDSSKPQTPVWSTEASCGPTKLSDIALGTTYDSVQGTVAGKTETCKTAGWVIDDSNVHAFKPQDKATLGVCTYYRSFLAKG